MEPYYIQYRENDEEIVITIKKKTILEMSDSIKDDFDVVKIIHNDDFFFFFTDYMSDSEKIEELVERSIEYAFEQPGEFLEVLDYSEDN